MQQRLNPADEEIVLEKADGKAWRILTPRGMAADAMTGSPSMTVGDWTVTSKFVSHTIAILCSTS